MTNTYDLFVGSYASAEEEAIHWLTFDTETEQLEKVSAISGIINPSFVRLNHAKTHLYAVSEVDEGEVVSYKIDYENKQLIELNRQPTKGGPCFIEIDEKDKFIFTANYGGGSFIVHPLLEDGQIGPHSHFLDYGTEAERKGLTSHAHAIKGVPNTNAFVGTDLGLDKLYVYKLDENNGKLETKAELSTKEGAGPRHLDFHEKLQVMYVLNQDNSTLLVYKYDKIGENFTFLEEHPTILEEFTGTNYCADIHITDEFVYVSNRGHHSVTSYKILEDGRLEPVATVTSGGEWPRGFAIVPNEQHVLVANEHTDDIKVTRITNDGSIEHTNNEIYMQKPVWIEFNK